MSPTRRDVIVSASALALLPDAAVGQAQRLRTPGDGRVPLDEGWKFAFGHLNDIDRDFGFGMFQRTFAKQGPQYANPNQPPDAVAATLNSFDDSAWRTLDLPHDWAVELPFVEHPVHTRRSGTKVVWDDASGHGYKPVGRDYPETSVGWYRRKIELTAEDKQKRIRIDFDGLFESAFVMFNGYIVYEHRGGYIPFSVDVTDFVNTDDMPNLLAVRVDASQGEGWYYEGAGIYRHVWLAKQDPVHIEKDGVCVRAGIDGKLSAFVTVCNASDVFRRIVTATAVTDPTNTIAATGTQTVELAPGERRNVEFSMTLASPRLWSLDDPYLYVLAARIEDMDGRPVETASIRFGVRDVRFDPDQGFFLNGKSVKIKGTCNHQDHAGVGVAVPDALWTYRLQCLKDMGCNAIRTAHNPPASELLDACDAMGILVLDETRLMTSSEMGLDQLRTLIIRDRNHPSIILWSIGNEEPQQTTTRGLAIARSMKRLIRELDPTRGITAAMNEGQGEGISKVLDVMGFNYCDDKIDSFHMAFPKQPIIGTETASALATRGEYKFDPARRVVSAYDVEEGTGRHIAEQWWSHFNAKPYISGGFIWSGFDYRGEPTPWQELPSISSHFGVLDTCGFAKDTAYYYRAWWRPEPLLHLFPHWNWEAGDIVSVWVFSNCDTVELFVNGHSAGRQVMRQDGHLEWKVPYAAGRVEAVGYKNDQVVLKTARQTAGAAARIDLSTDRARIAADGRDCAVLKAEIVDANGVPVPRAANLIRFAISGPARVIGVGNGDPNCHEPDKASQRSAYNGLSSAILQAGKETGHVTVTAAADGLASGKILLRLG